MLRISFVLKRLRYTVRAGSPWEAHALVTHCSPYMTAFNHADTLKGIIRLNARAAVEVDVHQLRLGKFGCAREAPEEFAVLAKAPRFCLVSAQGARSCLNISDT